jgi:hypothetical protein
MRYEKYNNSLNNRINKVKNSIYMHKINYVENIKRNMTMRFNK